MRRILVIDDHLGMRQVMAALLEDAGYSVRDAADANDLGEVLSTFRPDLVVTDICMPGKSGLELIEELKAENPDVRIIAISGAVEFQGGDQDSVFDMLLENAKRNGADATLSKPFEPGELLAAVQGLLSPAPQHAVG